MDFYGLSEDNKLYVVIANSEEDARDKFDKLFKNYDEPIFKTPFKLDGLMIAEMSNGMFITGIRSHD